MSANDLSDKHLVSRIYKKCLQFNIRKTQFKMDTGHTHRDFFKIDIQMANKDVKNAQHHWSLGKCKSNDNKRPLYTTRMAITKMTDNNKY